MADETIHTVSNEAAFQAQRELFLRIGGVHDHAAQDARASWPGMSKYLREGSDRLFQILKRPMRAILRPSQL
jgi:hypothetical protein